MKNITSPNLANLSINYPEVLIDLKSQESHNTISEKSKQISKKDHTTDQTEILFITSYPPRECGIATYSHDLIKVLNNKFRSSFSIKICALESGKASYKYPDEVKYKLNTSLASEYQKLAESINQDRHIQIVLIQHEFGFFQKQEEAFLQFIHQVTKHVVIVFHTVLPRPDELFKMKVQNIAAACEAIVVMTHNSAGILTHDYGVPEQKISVIAHGTHLVPHLSVSYLKAKYGFKYRKILTTFGLLSSGKSIETTLEALPLIVKKCPEVVFLIIGKTHPEVKKTDGEKYRESLEQIVRDYNLSDHVLFINKYVALPELLEYLQLTDIYLFTTNDPNQAVSGTFAYAMSCACPIISTPIPHAREVLTEDTGIIFDFRNSKQLANGVLRLLKDEPLRRNISFNTLQKIAPTAWENSAVAHAMMLGKIAGGKISIRYSLPDINLNHLKRMTTDTGIIQFSKINHPDISSGYTLDDNARALVAMCMYFRLTGDARSIKSIQTYLSFIKYCLQPEGNFLNYVDKNLKFTAQNDVANLEDSNGRAIWALGYLASLSGLLPPEITSGTSEIIQKTLSRLENIHSTRAMAFAIKGLYYAHKSAILSDHLDLIKIFANRLVQMYKHESNEKWQWFEGYLTYANSILPEAMLYSWMLTGESIYKDIARSSFDFLLSQIFNENGIEVISNKNWLQKGQEAGHFGEQPIDVGYTIMTLSNFYDVLGDNEYQMKMVTAFNWFLGNNRLHQIVYNPCTGGCYDGLEEKQVNLNQGAESTLSYLMARLTMEKYTNSTYLLKTQIRNHIMAQTK
jgi:glycosyltransferase involved in cell wall biosynthesis